MNPFIAKDDGKYVLFSITFAVVPYVGTWIEISIVYCSIAASTVVPYVGTWIEISGQPHRRLPLTVVPYVGTWIEMQ